jgi:hypothetical protein
MTQVMEKAQKNNFTCYNAPSSETFKVLEELLEVTCSNVFKHGTDTAVHV